MNKIKGILYIGILFLLFINNVKTKTFQDSIKNVLWSRKALSLLQEDVESLKDILKPFFKIGTFISPFELTDGNEFIIKHFSSLTPENELKPEMIINLQACQSEGNNVNTQVYFSSGTTKILKFCEDNGIPIHGHTFVWYSQTPSWFFKEDFNPSGAYVTTDIMDQRLESFIKNTFDLLAKNFPKLEIYAYDVVNEIFINDGGECVVLIILIG